MGEVRSAANVKAVMIREMRSLFNSPIAYVVIVFFLVFTSVWLFFIRQFFAQNVASLSDYFGIFPTIFILVIPAITMRSWAEERKLGTDELLLTFPIRISELVFGKFLAGLALLIIVLILTVPVALTVMPFGFFQKGQIGSEYLGVLFLGAASLSVGLLVSALSTNQITAFLLTAFLLLVLTFVGEIPKFVSMPFWIASVFSYLSIDAHFASFRKGLLDSRDLAYFTAIAIVCLYSNVKVVVFGKWK